jgi:transcriptional regulator of heat shock response
MKILKNVIYNINNIVIEKNNSGITLIKNDIVIEDLFEIIIFIIKNEKKVDKTILDIEITLADKKNSNILNLIY